MIKDNKDFVGCSKIPHLTCLRPECENLDLFVKGMNNYLGPRLKLPEKCHDLVAVISCQPVHPKLLKSLAYDNNFVTKLFQNVQIQDLYLQCGNLIGCYNNDGGPSPPATITMSNHNMVVVPNIFNSQSLHVDQYNNHISNQFGGLQKFSQSNRSIQYVLNIIIIRLIKDNKDFVGCSKIPHLTCLCPECENLDLFVSL